MTSLALSKYQSESVSEYVREGLAGPTVGRSGNAGSGMHKSSFRPRSIVYDDEEARMQQVISNLVEAQAWHRELPSRLRWRLDRQR